MTKKALKKQPEPEMSDDEAQALAAADIDACWRIAQRVFGLDVLNYPLTAFDVLDNVMLSDDGDLLEGETEERFMRGKEMAQAIFGDGAEKNIALVVRCVENVFVDDGE